MACPVCFGDSNEPMAVATNYGIWFMLGIVAIMISAFATFFLYLMRRAKLRGHEVADIHVARESGPADAGPYVRGQEGTA